jgi:superfamily II DNA or RNA helicase
VSKRQLRAWQREAFELYQDQLAKGEKQALWEATPGAGKTTAALRVVKHQLIQRLAEKAFIVVPTSHLKIQWATAALSFGLQLDPNFGSRRNVLASDFDGAVVTYQQFKNNQKCFYNLASRSVVILDEVHHAAEGLSWGTSIIQTLQKARFILCLSGTAFRSDNNPIPYVKYDSEGLSTPDFCYSYTRAIREQVCRPAAIFTYGGEVSWTENDQIYRASFSDNLDNIASARRHRSALDPSSGWIKPMLRDAHEMLLSLRKEQANAGGLIVCPDHKIARQMVKLVHEVCGEKPTLVLSDEAAASKKIKTFSNSNSFWLLACNMVSEGVDIPRLRVGVYASSIKTKMYFRQFLGRIVRRLPIPSGPQVAYLYLPADPALTRLAEEIEQEAQHSLNKPREDLFADVEALNKSNKEKSEKSWSTLDAYNSGVDSIILHGNQLPLFGTFDGSDRIQSAINHEVESKLEERITRSEEKSMLAREIRQLVGIYHKKSGKSHAQIHSSINKTQKVSSQTECTLPQLQERLALLKKMNASFAKEFEIQGLR